MREEQATVDTTTEKIVYDDVKDSTVQSLVNNDDLSSLDGTNGSRVKLSKNALTVVEKRYLRRSENDEVIETPEQMFRRIAKSMAMIEREYGIEDNGELKQLEDDFYGIMARLEFMPASPTIKAAGLPNGQLSACFVLPVEDSMTGIFDALKNSALIHQSGGGTGFSFSKLRPYKDVVRGVPGVAGGPVSFMAIFNTAAEEVTQTGLRKGANMAMLRVDHPDVDRFILAKKEHNKLNNFNISIAATDAFMEAVKNEEEYDVINPHTKKVVRTEKAHDMFEKMVHNAWEGGDPGIVFIDKINEDNPTPEIGEIEATNPCLSTYDRVLTDVGYLTVQEYLDEYSHLDSLNVLSRDGSIQKASNFYYTGDRTLYEVKLQGGYTVETTDNHEFHMLDGSIKQLKDLQVGDEIPLQDHSLWPECINLPFDVVNKYVGENNRTYSANLPEQWSRDLGFVMGWLVGDGWLRDDDNYCVGFVFALADKEAFHRVKSIVDGWVCCDIKHQTNDDGTTQLIYREKLLVDFMKNLGVTSNKGMSKSIPFSIFRAPSCVAEGFLEGLFSADGSVVPFDNQQSRCTISLSSVSYQLVKDVQVLLSNFCIRSSIYNIPFSEKAIFSYVTKDGTKKTYKPKSENYFDLRISPTQGGKIFYDRINFALTYKKVLLDDIVKIVSKKKIKECAKIVSIKELLIEPTYCLTVENTHNMYVNGVLTGNCGEQPLLPYESCNLGSINLAQFEKDGKIDYKSLQKTVHLSVRFLDNVIDVNRFPVKEIEDITKANRKIGLGVMGFADLLLRMNIPYNSAKAVKLAGSVMRFVNEEAKKASEGLAVTRGAFPNFEKSIYKKSKPIRNAARTTIAPTGTISIIADCSSGIEPIYALSHMNVMVDPADDSKSIYIPTTHPYFENVARERGFYSDDLRKEITDKGSVKGMKKVPEDVRKLFVTAHDIDPIWHIKMQAAFQKHTDNAVSKTINLSNEATIDDVRNAYILAYDLKCKGITIYRDGSRDVQALVKGNKEEEQKDIQSEPRVRLQRLKGESISMMTGCGKLYVTINEDEDGNMFELFNNMGKAGGCAASQCEAIGRLVSLAWRSGIKSEEVFKQLRGISCHRTHGFGKNKVLSCADAIGQAIGQYIEAHDEPFESKMNGGACPDCGGIIEPEGGCSVCRACGYTECG